MKFRYQYRTKDNEVRCGEIVAADRDAAYAQLRAKGVKASRMEEAPGLLNKLFGKGKRWIVIGVLGVLCLVLFVYLESAKEDLAEATRIEDCVPRHQIYGDPEVVAKFGSFEGLKMILGNDGDALLACFAQPGKVAELGDGIKGAELLEQSLTAMQQIVSDDSREIKELKQIVNWMRGEMLTFVNFAEDERSIKKKLETYFQRMIQRVANEKRIYDVAERELRDCVDERVREEKNAKLRKLGLPTIVAEEK